MSLSSPVSRLAVCLAIGLVIGPAAVLANWIGNIHTDFESPACRDLGQIVHVTYDYSITEAGGARIVYSPMVDGHFPPSYHTGTYPVLPPGTGSGSGWFYVSEGDVWIDHIRLKMVSAETGDELLRIEVPVQLHYGPCSIQNIVFNPASPAILDNASGVTVQFDYNVTGDTAFRLWVTPLAYGHTAGWFSTSFDMPPGSGSLTREFGVSEGSVTVDQVHFLMADTNGNALLEFTMDTEYHFGPTVVASPPAAPDRPVLLPNDPNPFNPSTRIAFTLPRAGHARLTIHDLLGRRLRCLLDGPVPAGRTELTWHGRDDAGRSVPSGIYLYRLEADGTTQSRRMTLVR